MGNKKKEIGTSYTVVRYTGDLVPDKYNNYIRSKWMRSYRLGNPFIKLCNSDSYYSGYTIFITKLLLRHDTMFRLAVLTDDKDVVLGFSATRDNILDYVFVHKDYRRQGIGNALVPAHIDTFTHLTMQGMSIWTKKMPKAVFDLFK